LLCIHEAHKKRLLTFITPSATEGKTAHALVYIRCSNNAHSPVLTLYCTFRNYGVFYKSTPSSFEITTSTSFTKCPCIKGWIYFLYSPCLSKCTRVTKY